MDPELLTTTAETASSWPWWGDWVLYPVIVAAVVVAMSEWPKRWWFKPTAAWQAAKTDREKIAMLAPLLLGLGALIGGPIYAVAGLKESWLLCFAIGAGTGVLSATIYDVSLGVLAAIPGAFKARFGVRPDEDDEDEDQVATGDHEPVEEAPPAIGTAEVPEDMLEE